MRQYVITIHLNVLPKNEASFIIDYKEIEKGKAFDLYLFFSTCRYIKEECDEYEDKKNIYFINSAYLIESYQLNIDFIEWKDHSDIVCKINMIIKNRRKVKYNFYFAIKLVIDELSDNEYVVLLRRKPFRELLLISHPNNDESINYKYYNNEALV